MAGDQYATIAVMPATKNRIEAWGKKAETWDELLNRMADAAGVEE